MRYFTYVFKSPGSRRELGHVTKKVYWFKYAEITPVEDQDGDYFLYLGSPELGNYPFMEVDVDGNAVGSFPPEYKNRAFMINPLRFPSDQGVPEAAAWRLATETMSDPVLFFHYIREKR